MPEQNSIINDEQNEIKKRATRRLIIAVALVAIAVIVLTVLSKQKSSKPVTIEPPVPAIAPQPQAEIAPPPTPEAVPSPAEGAGAAPAVEMPTEAPPPPEVAAQPTLKPAPQVRAAQKPTAPAPPKPLPHELPAPEQPALTKEAKGTGEKPVSATAAPEAMPAAVPKGYVVQLGVFSNPANAIQLQEKLAAHGIKSYTETKLHVGPFKDKAEADQALAKIRALGISAVVVPQH